MAKAKEKANHKKTGLESSGQPTLSKPAKSGPLCRFFPFSMIKELGDLGN
jgi:hypothetical protein